METEHGDAREAPADERAGNRHASPKPPRHISILPNLPAEQYPAGGVVLLANGRCDQEDLTEQLKNGVKAMKMPAGDPVSNWAYMVMASLAWALKAWAGLLLPVGGGACRGRDEGRKRDVVRMEFKRFLASLVHLPCQVVRAGRRVVLRLLAWNPWAGTLLRAARAWRRPLTC